MKGEGREKRRQKAADLGSTGRGMGHDSDWNAESGRSALHDTQKSSVEANYTRISPLLVCTCLVPPCLYPPSAALSLPAVLCLPSRLYLPHCTVPPVCTCRAVPSLPPVPAVLYRAVLSVPAARCRPARLYLLRGALFLGAADQLLILPAVGLVRRLWGARLTLVLRLVLQIGAVPYRLRVPARQLRPETAPRRGDGETPGDGWAGQ